MPPLERRRPGWRLLPGLLLLAASVILGLARAQQPPRPISANCNGPGEARNGGYCFPGLRRCLQARYEAGDLRCLQYSHEFRLVDGYAYLDSELPDKAVSSTGLVQIGPADCWNVVPGNHNQCAVCRFQAAGQGLCRPGPLELPGCLAMAHPHLNEDCAQCAPGHWLTLDRGCVSDCPTPGNVRCGAHCIPRHLVPDTFDCDAWPMARPEVPSTDDTPGRPEHAHLLKCSRPGICFECHASCDECAGPGPKDCTRCPAGRLLLAHSSKTFPQGPVPVGACTRPYRANGDPDAPVTCPATTVQTDAGACLPCRPNCRQCDPTDPAICLACMRGFFARPDGTCGDTCPLGTARDSPAGRCTPCTDPKCAQCASEDPGICLACKSSAFNLHDNNCLHTCPATFFHNKGVCMPCVAGCALCDDGFSCYRCFPSYRLEVDDCYSPCGSRATWDFDLPPAEQGCRPCHENCDTCTLYTNNCTSCKSGMYQVMPREKGARVYCAAQCPEGFFLDNNRRCQPCRDPNCATCTSNTNCTACKFGHALVQGTQCFATCPEGYYKHSKQCLPCGGGCGTCSTGLGVGCLQCTASPLSIPRVKELHPGSFDVAPPARCTADALTQPGWGLFYQTQKARYAVPCPAHCLSCFVRHPHDPAQRTVQCVACAPGHTLSADGLACPPSPSSTPDE
ncbi:hypothetical protein H696_01006 [Fonticula alba]|uniref:EGF-like domain-containing protein n=1 Tax=Fonticula alba TaxID=691883 RepID=A0A058ZIY8_FONAL|nr:hypothetical protein H696_01006 [Fonticula alba]KCV73467.1 hypothetical protein H696_01006 [Fonticula alba]|eukprot:XP_009493168.1 hypothetical protein H696_01006 [Fonticula alba]